MTLKDQLKQLQALYEEGLLNEAEYQARRGQLLDSLGTGAGGYRPAVHTQFTLIEGQEIGPDDRRFRLAQEIGGGAMGRVWKAHDLAEEALLGGERFKALKVLAPELVHAPRALENLKKEAINAARLSHPHIINVYGWRQGRDQWVFVEMDYLPGRDLDRLLGEEGDPGLPLERALELLAPMAEGLDYAYEKHQLVHRDLKPGNVFITADGDIKLLDFGLAHQLRKSRSSLAQAVQADPSGTPLYMPPEAFVAGKPDRRQDIYALACLGYELLTGEPPYNEAAARTRPRDLYPPRPEPLSEGAWKILKAGLAYEREERPGSAQELVWGMRAVGQAGSAIAVNIQPPSGTASPPPAPLPKGGEAESGAKTAPKIEFIHGWSTSQVQAYRQAWGEYLGVPIECRDEMDDHQKGPVMVLIPPGEYLMGAPEDEPESDDDERPLHRVTISQAFYIGRYAVTFAEYDRYCEAVGIEKPGDECWARGDRPVIRVSWNNATAYAEWLSRETGRNYRLPTEAEWEYAARAGTACPFSFEGPISTGKAHYDGRYSYNGSPRGMYRKQTLPVRSFAPNPWGLYQVHGNVWEWTCSAYDKNYGGSEKQCVSSNDATRHRALRGGSWFSHPRYIRSATRLCGSPYYGTNFISCRILASSSCFIPSP